MTRHTDPVLEQSPVITWRLAHEAQQRISSSLMLPKPIASWKNYFGKSPRLSE